VLLMVELDADEKEGWLLSREDFQTIVKALEAQPAPRYRVDLVDNLLTFTPVRHKE